MGNVLRRYSFGHQPVDGILGNPARVKQSDNQARCHAVLLIRSADDANYSARHVFFPGVHGSGARGSRSVTTSTTTGSPDPSASASAGAISPGRSTRMPRTAKLLAQSVKP